jgi:hypothetical protein
METNGIVILVLWIVIAVLTIIFGFIKSYNMNKKLEWVCIILIIITFLVNFGYSVYLTHTSKDTKDNSFIKWLVSTIASGLIGAIIIYNTGSNLMEVKK